MLANLLASLRRPRKKSHPARQHRRLRVDALEERTLLSVTPVDILDKLANQSIQPVIPSGNTNSGQSLAVDADGDFVIVWTRYDTIIDPNTGLPVIDPVTGQPKTEANIYARYFTDEVQRITLPSGVLNDNVPSQYGQFSLIYGGTTLVQKLTISATYEPFAAVQQNIVGTFVLQADANGDGIISPTERATIVYDETNSISNLATSIQTALQGIGGPLQNAKVTPINAKEFLIEYGSAALGVNQPKLSVGTVNFSSGFYPAVQVSTVREPILISNIPVSPTNPQLTAQALEQAFNTRLKAYAMGPIDFPPPDRVPSSMEGPYTDPITVAAAVPQVQVTAVNATTFDIRFVGDSSKLDHPEFIIASVTDELGNNLLPSPEASVVTIKQSSPEFRVNPEEPDDPFTPGPDKYDQTNPAVAMDADGDFIIVWESKVPDSYAYGSVSDIFARRFRPVGNAVLGVSQFVVDMNADGTPETPIDGVIPLVSPLNTVVQTLTVDSLVPGTLAGRFRLSVAGKTTDDIVFDSTNLATTAANIQGALVVAGFQDVSVTVASSTDPYQFRISFRQTFSGPNGLADAIVRYVDPVEGTPLGALATVSSQLVPGQDLFTFRVNTETLRAQFAPAVAMDLAGNFVIAWANSAQDFSFYNGIRAQIFSRDGNRIGNEFLVNTEDTAVYLNPAVGMSRTGEFVIAWERTTDVNYLTGAPYVTTVLAKGYDLTGQVILPQFGVGGGGNPTVAFDSANHFLVTWSAVADADSTGQTSIGVRAIVYDLNGNVIRDTFRPNSASFSPGSTPLWPLAQFGGGGGLDADGDLIVAYDGYGPDVSENARGVTQAVRQLLLAQINSQTNADLLNYFDPQTETLFSAGSPSNGDVDGVIDAILVRALNRGATPEQVGRLRAILEGVAGLLRGEANGVMFSRFDADPTMSYGTLFSDSVANTLRDGHNTRYLILMNNNLNWESFIIRIWRTGIGGFEDVTVNNIQTNQVWDRTLTRDRIDQVLEGAARTGTAWAEPTYEGPIDVRIISPFEVANRIGTPWEIPVANPNQYTIYEVTFQGASHDWPFTITGVYPGRAGGQDVAPPLMIAQSYGDPGTEQGWASIGVTPEGSFVVAYTQMEQNTDGSLTNATIRYRQFRETVDTAGPFVTDIIAPTGTSLWGGANVQGSISQVVITFNEELLGGDPRTVLDSVLNPDNFVLLRNGVEIPRGVVKVEFGMNAASLLNGKPYDIDGDGNPDGVYQLYALPTNKWEAVLTLDGNGALEPGTPGLPDGDYQIVIRAPSGANAGIRDKAGNPLNSTGFVPAGANTTLSFHVTVPAQDTPVLPVNARTQPESPNAVARDADGDYVVVWTQTDASGRNRVYFRLFDRDGTPADLDLNGNGVIDVTEIDNAPAMAVTTSSVFANDDQQFGSVAMTPDGDFVITWTNTRNGNADIYARRFGSNGQPLGDAFRVNTFTSNDQKWSDVAMDAEGNFVVVWSSWGQEPGGSASGWGIFARRFDQQGQALDATEFQVNTTVVGDQTLPSVSMDYRGNFAVAWQTVVGALDTDIAVAMYSWSGAVILPETIVNVGRAGQQTNPDIVLAPGGDRFAVTWTGLDTQGTGVFAQVYAPDPTTGAWVGLPADILVNTTIQGDQRFSSIAMDGVGNFVVAWSGYGTQRDEEDLAESGVFYQRFDRAGNPLGGERRVNQVVAGRQWIPSVASDADGNFIVVYTGPSATNPSLTTVYRFDSRNHLTLDDIAAPIVTKVWTEDRQLITEGSRVVVGPSQLIVQLSEEMSRRLSDANNNGIYDAGDIPGPDSVLNVQNWRLFRNGQEVVGAVKSVSFSLNPVTRKWEAVLTLDGNPDSPINDPLPSGDYQLLVGDLMTDAYPYFRVTDPVIGFQLDGDRDGVPGTAAGLGFVRTFIVGQGSGIGPGTPGTPGDTDINPVVNTTLAGDQSLPAVAMNANGDYVVVWVSVGQGADANTTNTNIIAQRYNRRGEPQGTEFIVNTYETGNQTQPAVAMDSAGNFIVVWAGEGADDVDGVWARMFDRFGNPLGDQFRVNQYRNNAQYNPRVAVSASGKFVVTWSSYGQDGDKDGVYARLYNAYGQALSNEFRVNTTTANYQRNSDVAMDDAGNFVVAWMSYGQDGSGYAVIGRVFNADGTARTGEIRLNQYTTNDQIDPRVAMDPNGNFVATWASFGQDGSGYGVYARLFNANGTARTNEFRVNQTTLHWQVQPDVAMDRSGNFTIVWMTSGQDNDLQNDWGIYARMFTSSGTDFYLPPKGFLGEFRVNAAVAGNQTDPAVAMDAVGNFVVVWTGPSTDPDPLVAAQNGTDIFARLIDPPSELTLQGTSGNDTLEFIAGSSLATSTIKLNGQVITPSTSIARLIFEAGDGQDTVIVTGTNGQEIVTLWPTGGQFKFPGGFTVEVRSAERITVDAKGGTNDQLTVYDSAGNDSMTASPTQVTATNSANAYSHLARNFEQVTLVSSAGGEDTASLYDSPGDDIFTGTPTYGEMAGTGYKLRAEGFRYLHGYALAGGADTAMLYDSPGDDEYVGTPDYNIMRNSNFFVRAKYFDYVHAYATAGGYDRATLKGTSGADKFVLEPNLARLNSGTYVHRAKFFEEITIRGGGGQDVAYVDRGTVLPGVVARGTPPVPVDAAQIAYLQQLYKIQVTNEGGTGSNRTIRPAADAVFSAYWP
ncbi:MAG: hypothetical protein WHT09_03220 [Thermogutta sp.]